MPKRCETMFRNIGIDDRMWDRLWGRSGHRSAYASVVIYEYEA
jgi:hypothetical protein